MVDLLKYRLRNNLRKGMKDEGQFMFKFDLECMMISISDDSIGMEQVFRSWIELCGDPWTDSNGMDAD